MERLHLDLNVVLPFRGTSLDFCFYWQCPKTAGSALQNIVVTALSKRTLNAHWNLAGASYKLVASCMLMMDDHDS